MLRKLFFDKQDHQLLQMINATIDRGAAVDMEHQAFDPNLHPHGILELTTTHAFRMAHAVVNLLGNLKTGREEDRLIALRTLRDEVLHSARSTFRYNTGRVLIQIMKEIVRSRNDELRQLKLVRDFRSAATGNPRLVRYFLNRHNLLEMPEEENQLTLDHHVHDVNTKGRKNPTHLIMDAWVKGIRYLTVIYYNCVEPAAARELMEAAEIMNISIRIGMEFRAPFRGRYISFVWAPRGFSDSKGVLAFLAEQPMLDLMWEGQEVSNWVRARVLATLDVWNTKHRLALAQELGIDLPVLDPGDFLAFVGAGRSSLLHLAEFIHVTMLPLLRQQMRLLQKELPEAEPDRAEKITALIQRMDSLTPEVIMDSWIRSERNPDVPSPNDLDSSPNCPKLLRLPPQVLINWLTSLRSGYRITLQLADLTPEDVVELLWDCEGKITHLEIFNLKEWQDKRLENLEKINMLQIALNEGSALHLKRMLRNMIHRMEEDDDYDEEIERRNKFRVILRNIPKLQGPYKLNPLSSRIGTDSTSHSSMRHGMGLAILETLPPNTRRVIRRGKRIQPLALPVQVSLSMRETYVMPRRTSVFAEKFGAAVRKLWGCKTFGLKKNKEWRAISSSVHIGKQSNVITMGGISEAQKNGFCQQPESARSRNMPGLRYLNTHFSNILKMLIGFIPAMMVFAFTQHWWVLAWLGAPIWFLITGLRNIAQAVLGGGGFRRSALLHWSSFVDWVRISDSLMYTGLSVVLLEWIIRDLLLDRTLGFTTYNSPLLVFTIIAMANSLYIIAHNIFRGFPKEAIIGNIFRTILAIPFSLIYNDLLLAFMTFCALPNPLEIVDQSASITSKAASDTVAGLIEGFADGRNNHRLRYWDYQTKLASFFDIYAQLELQFPNRDILSIFSHPKEFIRLTVGEAHYLYVATAINALDLMYFWMYQSYARQTLLSILRTMTREERLIFARGQLVLTRVREVSQLFVDGMIGQDFAKALAFYLDSYKSYVQEMNAKCRTTSKYDNFDNDMEEIPEEDSGSAYPNPVVFPEHLVAHSLYDQRADFAQMPVQQMFTSQPIVSMGARENTTPVATMPELEMMPASAPDFSVPVWNSATEEENPEKIAD